MTTTASSEARRRWALLRAAIRSQEQPEGRPAAAADAATVVTVPGLPEMCLMVPRQPPPRQSPMAPLDRLISHRLHDGVDNTGNVRVWPAEAALLAWCLQQCPADFFAGKRVLELGAGMAGLAGLGVACYANPPPAAVVLTDGHPDCVAALEACVALNQSRLRCPVSVRRLVWGKDDSQGSAGSGGGGGDGGTPSSPSPASERMPLDLTGRVDVVLAADVLFFEQSHGALLAALGQVLGSPEATAGEAWLLQPSRGGSLERFVARAAEASGGEAWDVREEGLMASISNSSGGAGDETEVLRLLHLQRAGRRSAQGSGGSRGRGERVIGPLGL